MMGKSESKPLEARNINLESLLRNAMKIAHIPVPDLYAYREEIKPAIEKIVGNKESMLTIKVDRNKIYEAAASRFTGKIKQLSGINRPIHEKPVIDFGDTDLLDVDGSGFRREYYSVYFRQCLSRLFEGNGRQMVPKKDITIKDELKALGIAIVECILNEDCGFPYLHVAIYKTIVGCSPEEIEIHLNISDLPDSQVKMVVQQINDATTEKEMTEAVSCDDAGFLGYIGWPVKQTMTLKNRDTLLQYILRWYMIDNRKDEIEQLRQGLSYMGFLDTIRTNEWFEPLMVYSQQYSISAEYIQAKLKPAIEKLDAKTEQEKTCKTYALSSIQSLTDEQARLLFAFITNLYDPPISEESLDVKFNHANKGMKLPESYTCINRLLLPLGNKSLDEFTDSFLKSIEEVGK